MTGKDNLLLYFRYRHLRDEVEVVIGRPAVRVILALLTLALAAVLAASDSARTRDLVDVIRRLPPFR